MARSRTSAIGLGLRVVLWPLPVLLLALITLGMRLAAGPVDVPIPERALNALMAHAAPGWRMEASGAQFDLFGKDGLTGLKLRDVRLLDPEGAEATTVPELGLSMALVLSDTASEAVHVKGIRIDGARLDVVRGETGELVFGLGGLFGGSGAGAGLWFGDLFAAEGETSPLPIIVLSDVRVGYRDAARGVAMAAYGSTVVFDPAGTIRLDGRVDTDSGDAMPLDIEITRLADGTIAADVVFDDVYPPTLAAFDPALAPLDAMRMGVRGSARARLTPQAAIMTATATLRATKGGTVIIGGQPRAVERLAVDIAYTPESLHADFHEIAIDSDGLTLSAHGAIERTDAESWAVTATAPRIAYAAPDGAQRVEAGPVSVKLAVEAGRVTIDEFAMAAPVLHLTRENAILKATALNIAGRADPAKGTAALSTILLDGLDAILDGHEIRARQVTTTASITPDTATLRAWALHDLAVRTGETTATAAQVSGAARFDRRTGIAGIDDFALRTLRLALPDGNAIAAPSLGARGTVDTRAGQLSMDRIDVPRAVVALPAQYGKPLTLDSLVLSMDATARSVDLSGLSTMLHGIPVEGRVRLYRDEDATRARAELTVSKTDIGRIVALWPVGTLAGGRKWLAGNVHRGAIGNLALNAQVDTANPAKDALALTFDFADGTVTAIPGMPPLSRARGRGEVSLGRVDIFLASAHVAVPGTPGYSLGKSRISIPDFSPDVLLCQIELDVAGPAQSVLRFLDHAPLSLVESTRLDIAKFEGEVASKVRIKLPLTSDIDVKDVDFEADTALRAFSFVEPHTGVRIRGDTLSARVTPKGLTFRADARFDDLSARMKYKHAFAAPAPGQPEGVLTLQSYLTREDFALRAGIDISDHFDGVAVLDSKVDLFPGGGARFAMSGDLTGSTLRIDPLGWVKTDGVPVTVEATGFRNPNGAGQVEKITVRGSGISARGRMGFAPGGIVQGIDFERIVLADLLDAGMLYRRATDAAPRRIEVAGAYLDLGRAFSDAMDASGTRQASAPNPNIGDGPLTEIALRLASVRLRDDLSITDLDGGVRLSGEHVLAAKIDGRLNGTAPAQALAERRGDGMAIRLTSRDAGAFLDAASVFEGARGGTLRVDARTRDTTLPARIAGTARANGITIRDSPTMKRILSGGVGSLMQQMMAGGLTFDKIELPFSGVGGRWAIADGVAWGKALGLTLDGTYDIERKGIDLTGTVSPAYAINGALGSIPLLGTLLTGGEGEGMFGITFAVRGTTDNPKVWVNPLSALAPGFLRKIVSGVMDGGHVVDTTVSPSRSLRAAER